MTPDRFNREWRILVVDDDEIDRMAVVRALRETNTPSEVVQAGSVAEGVAALEEGGFDCALVDFHLPDGDGRSVLAAARRIPGAPPIVMVTGQGDEGLAVQLMKDGAEDYLIKGSFDADRLIRSIRYALGSRRARDQEKATAALHQALAEAERRFGRSLDFEATLDTIVHLFVPAVADGCRVRTLEGDRREIGTPPEGDDGPSKGGAVEGRRMKIGLRSGGQELGVLEIWREPGRPRFSEGDHVLVANLADRAAASLDNARLYRDLQEESEIVTTLNRVGRALTSQLDPEAIGATVAEEGLAITGAQYAALYYLGEPKEGLSDVLCTATALERADAAKGRCDVPGKAGLLALLDGAEPVVVDDGASGITHPFGEDAEIRSYLAVPVHVPDGPLRAGLFFAHRSPNFFGARTRELAEGLAGWAGVALGNARLLRKANAAVQVRDEVMGIVSHDLRNPLNVMLFTANMLLDMEMDAAMQEDQLQRIKRAGDRMSRLIQDLLDVTRLEAGRLSVAREPEDVERLMGEVDELMGPLAQERKLHLVREGDVTGLRADLDRERMVQLFSNLLGNALKFTPEGGQVRYGVHDHGEHVLFFVSDNGPGIPEEQLPRLFERFWQGRRADREGAGLGLPISKGIVEAHGGTLEVETRVGEGTTFHIRIPKRGGDQQESGS